MSGPERREEVFVRMAATLEAVMDEHNVRTFARNRGLLGEDRLPAFFLLDGDETVSLPSRRTGQRMSPCLVTMHPQVWIVLKTAAKPKNEDIGADLNALRAAVITAIAYDDTLVALLGANGSLAYEGCETDLKAGEAMDGTMLLTFGLTTALIPYS